MSIDILDARAPQYAAPHTPSLSGLALELIAATAFSFTRLARPRAR